MRPLRLAALLLLAAVAAVSSSMADNPLVETFAQKTRSDPDGCYANAAPTMILRIRSHGDPCEMLLVCVG